jgi:hypothetical protein
LLSYGLLVTAGLLYRSALGLELLFIYDSIGLLEVELILPVVLVSIVILHIDAVNYTLRDVNIAHVLDILSVIEVLVVLGVLVVRTKDF